MDEENQECTPLCGTSKRRWEDNVKLHLTEIVCEVAGTGSGPFPLAGFDSSGDEHSGVAITV